MRKQKLYLASRRKMEPTLGIEALSPLYEKLQGESLALCHGRADVRILPLDYDRTLFIDKDPAVLGDFDDQMIDNILAVHCYENKLYLTIVKHLNPHGYLFITPFKNDNKRIDTLEQLGMKYLGYYEMDIYRVSKVRPYTFLTFQKA